MESLYKTNAAHRPIVYVRPVAVADLPAEAQAQLKNHDQVWAVHAETGDRLALVAERGLAFTLARQNDLQPVTVH